MKMKDLTLSELEKVTGGEFDSTVTEALDEAIYRAKRATKTMEECIRDFYLYNRDFTAEHEKYIRDNWDRIK